MAEKMALLSISIYHNKSWQMLQAMIKLRNNPPSRYVIAFKQSSHLFGASFHVTARSATTFYTGDTPISTFVRGSKFPWMHSFIDFASSTFFFGFDLQSHHCKYSRRSLALQRHCWGECIRAYYFPSSPPNERVTLLRTTSLP